VITATTILPQAASGSTTPTPGSGLPTPQGLDNMFLQLLVAQLQNQDPTSPMDPTQFVSQLAQFSELSEVSQIYQLLQQAVPGTSGSSRSGSSSSGGTSGGSASTNSSSASAMNPVAHMAPSAILPAAGGAAPPADAHVRSVPLSLLNHTIEGVF